MNEAKTIPEAGRNMREAPKPFWPDALEQAALRTIASVPALADVRAAALSALRRAGMPQAGSEDFTFLRVSELLGPLSAVPDIVADGNAARSNDAAKTVIMPAPERIRSLIFPESRENYLVLLDGEYSPALSHPAEGITVVPLESALAGAGPGGSPASPPAPFKAALLAALERESDAAAALAALFASQPLLIRVAPKAAPAAPLQILHLHVASAAPRQDVFLAVDAGRLSEIRILVRHADAMSAGPGADRKLPMSNVHALLLLEEAASVKWLESAPEDAGNDSAIHFHKLGAVLERDSRLLVVTASTGAKVARNAYAVDLRGQGAEAEINGAAVLSGARQAHHFVQVRHLAAHCTSRQHFKIVAADRSRSSVDGTIYVGEGAQLTNANQLINNLMLSDEARADSKPRLLIHADDVKCTHGATAGKLDAAQQFYLESRGLSAGQARALLTLAFIAEVAERADKALGLAGGPGAVSGFRAHLDATLLDTLKRRLADPGA